MSDREEDENLIKNEQTRRRIDEPECSNAGKVGAHQSKRAQLLVFPSRKRR
jgi:hypothetical protein